MNELQATNPRLWRIDDDSARHYWHYLSTDDEASARPQTAAEKWFLGLDTGLSNLPKATTAAEAASNCLEFFSNLQMPSGHWACEFTGPNVDIPGIVITLYVTGQNLKEEEQTELIRYICNIQNKDGGWGLHLAGESTVYATTLHYVVLRILGVSSNHKVLQDAKACLNDLGGVLYSPQIAKFWLAVLGVLPWDIVEPMPPEIWLLPDWTPISPWRWWVYPRAIHLPMGYVWSRQWSYAGKDKDPLVSSLREELLGKLKDADSATWMKHRAKICPRDDFHSISLVLTIVFMFLNFIFIPYLRTRSLAKRAEDWVYTLIKLHDENTEYATIASIVAPISLLVRYIEEGEDSNAVQIHRRRLHDYFWMTKKGLAVNVTSGVQTWDTAFAMQAVVAAGLASQTKFRNCISRALKYLDEHQMDHAVGYESSSAFSEPPTKATAPETGYWHPRKGAWGFSEKAQGYPVSDCTAEALKAVVLLQSLPNRADTPGSGYLFPTVLSGERLKSTVDILLTYQDDSGGSSCYEPSRGSEWLECLNPSQIFDNLMVAYDYPECTGSCLTALHMFRQLNPDYRADEIQLFIQRAMKYVHKSQRPDGSWKGTWGVCFTYASYFTLEALASQGETHGNSECVRRACQFLIGKQLEYGGWGESYESAVTGQWVDHPEGAQVVQTAWALIALLEARYPEKEPLRRGIRFIMGKQQPNGEFLEEDFAGAHNRSCVLKYPNYSFIFPIKALGMYSRRFETFHTVDQSRSD